MDTVKLEYPCYAVGIEPVPLDPLGRPSIEETRFFVVNDDRETAFLIVFRQELLLWECLDALQYSWQGRTIPIDTERQLHYLRKLLNQALSLPVGVLLDPDGNMNGYPLPSENWDGNEER